ncbi:MAG: hypothetical protein IKU37_01200 [Candidatus Gastranaerophilales bacterium]|nr:hypothetical protein [Candidatus Gastranaerophilales bacterium]
MDNMNNATTTGVLPTVPLASGDGFGFGGDGIWALLIFAMIFNNGWGFGNGNNNLATQDYVASEFTQQAINNGFENVNSNIANGFARTNDNLCDVRQTVATGDMALNSSILENRYTGQLSACQTQRDILTQTNELNTNLLTTALQNQAKMDECCCSIRNAIREDGEATRALITQNTIQDLRDRLNNAETVISNNTVINTLAPRSIPAYITSSPYQSIYNPYGGFYGNGFYGNTVI